MVRKASVRLPAAPAPDALRPAPPLPAWGDGEPAPDWRADLGAHTARPVAAQRQQAAPLLRALERDAAGLQRQQQHPGERLSQGSPDGTGTEVQAAMQRQAAAPGRRQARAPRTPGEWVQAAQGAVQRVQGPDPARSRPLSPTEQASHAATLRAVSAGLAQGFRADRGPALQRYAEYGESLATLQRQPLTAGLSRTVLAQVPPGERAALQRALDAAVQRQQAGLDRQAEQQVMARVRARQGGGAALPAAVQRQLEAGLNHDLSGVRVHTDPEADLLSRKVNALAFTSGRDIYFQSGKFDPNTRSGLELLAHEAAHVRQQAGSHVGQGIDPDAGLETEARGFGSSFAASFGAGLEHKAAPQHKGLTPPGGVHAPGVYSHQSALMRVKAGTVQATIHHPFAALQRQPSQEQAGGTIQRGMFGDAWHATTHAVGGAVNAVENTVKDGVDWAADKVKGELGRVLNAIPGYHELSLTFGRDLVTGQAMAQDPDALLGALANFVPGPLKDIIQAVRESGAIPKAWAWFEGQLGRLNLGGLLGDIGKAVKDMSLDEAKGAVMSRVGVLKDIITGSAHQIADIVLTAISAGLGPVGQKVMAGLRQGGDVILEVLKNPVKFAQNLLNGLKQGFGNFAHNAPQHFEQGVGGWLTGNSGVTLPPRLDLPGLFMTALTIMGLTYQNFRGRLVHAVGEQKVKLAEGSISMMKTLQGGLHHDPDMKGSEGPVGGEVLSGIKGEVQNSLIIAGVKKVVEMLVPGGGFLQAIIGAFTSVQFLIQRGAEVAGVIMNALGSVSAIAAGNIGAAASLVERSLTSAIPLALDLVGRLVGIGNLGAKVRGIIERVRGKLDALVQKIVSKVKGLIGKLPGAKKGTELNEKPEQRTVAQMNKDVAAAAREADGLLTSPESTPAFAESKLPAIKAKYKLSILNLIRESDGEYHIFAKVNPEITGPSRKLGPQEKLDIKSGVANVRQYETPYSPLTSKQKATLREKLKNRTITKSEMESLDWDRRFGNRRSRGVDRFWSTERAALRNGTSSRNWTQEQKADILAGRVPKFNGQPVEGHHRYNALDHPNIADLPENIHPATWDEHFNKWHGGNFRNDTFGSPNNPAYPDNF